MMASSAASGRIRSPNRWTSAERGRVRDFACRKPSVSAGQPSAETAKTTPAVRGKAYIRTQISAAHSRDDLQLALDAFAAVKCELGV
jgi:hypothetical protein